jgi:ankyrin repeat protein
MVKRINSFSVFSFGVFHIFEFLGFQILCFRDFSFRGFQFFTFSSEVLIEAGANLNQVSENYDTALLLATSRPSDEDYSVPPQHKCSKSFF